MANFQKIFGAGLAALDRFQREVGVNNPMLDILGSGNTVEYNCPSIDIINNDDLIILYIEIPGIERKNIQMSFLNNQLTVIGHKTIPYQHEDNVEKREIRYGEYRRTITLPLSVTNKENVATNYENGILIITIDKNKERENQFELTLT
uniref:Hsp20/alpha crystallin family protein n=1 Tax=Iridovirus LCIVAC01 TaxID=2506607 RepID=A0A481YQ22_9VIRU|nr:MAG: Hsp20/alpha crystallin family protein [Iridovirus LCIVAC01]